MGKIKSESSFTLIELVIAIGILAILAVVVIIVLNPSEFLRQSRDSTRMSDLQTINKSLGLYQADGGSSFGSTNKVYVSIPDNASQICASLGLPSLPTGWEYRCSNSTNYRKVDSNGWIPVNLTSISFGSSLDTLPIDPINTTSTGNYYTYVVGGSWNLTAFFESERYKMGGSSDKTSKDSGSYPELYEIGTNLTLLPVSRDPSLVGYWKLDETSGTLYDSSGHGNNGTQSGGVTYGATGKVGNALSFDGSDDYVEIFDSPQLRITVGTLILWAKFDEVPMEWGGPGLLSKSTNYAIRLSWGRPHILYSDGTWHQDTIAATQPQPGNWYHIAGVKDTNYLEIYINGVLEKQDSDVGSFLTSASELTIGLGWDPPRFKGLIDDVRIYNRALSAAEIAAIYNATK